MDAFFAHSDETAFDAVASPNITLHGDLLILDHDLSGADKVKSTLGTYTKAFEYKHENIAHGADIEGGSVFHFWLHKVCGMTAMSDEVQESSVMSNTMHWSTRSNSAKLSMM